MTSDPHHRRVAPVMWGAIGITLMILAVVAVYNLDNRIAGYAVGGLVLVCLAVCGAALWLDARTTRAADRPVGQFRRRSGHTTSKARSGSVPPSMPSPDRDLRPY